MDSADAENMRAAFRGQGGHIQGNEEQLTSIMMGMAGQQQNFQTLASLHRRSLTEMVQQLSERMGGQATSASVPAAATPLWSDHSWSGVG